MAGLKETSAKCFRLKGQKFHSMICGAEDQGTLRRGGKTRPRRDRNTAIHAKGVLVAPRKGQDEGGATEGWCPRGALRWNSEATRPAKAKEHRQVGYRVVVGIK